MKKPDRFWNWVPNELHLGANYWIKTQSPINGCNVGYVLGLRKSLPWDDWYVNWRHFSNGGTCKPNRGQDLLTIGYSFN